MSMFPRKQFNLADDPDQTQQQFRDDSLISRIVERSKRTGILGTGVQGNRKPIFADVSAFDFQEMNDLMTDIKGQFLSLPPKLRARFNNDAYQMIRFVENPENRDEATKLGLLQVVPDAPPKEPLPPPTGS